MGFRTLVLVISGWAEMVSHRETSRFVRTIRP